MKGERKILYAKVIQADKENAILHKKIEDFRKDKRFQEQVVRQELGWVKKNELLYRFVD